MTFKEFSRWLRNEQYNDRSLSKDMLFVCSSILYDVNARPKRIRERFWRLRYENVVMEHIFNSMNKETNKNILPYTEENIDLCSECQEAFEKFMKSCEKTNVRKEEGDNHGKSILL